MPHEQPAPALTWVLTRRPVLTAAGLELLFIVIVFIAVSSFIKISRNNLRFKIKSTQSTTACPNVAAGTDRFRQGRFGPTIEARSIRRRINWIRRENRLSGREREVVSKRLAFGWLLVWKSERLLTARARSRRRPTWNNVNLEGRVEG
jgi:hypothetical protein